MWKEAEKKSKKEEAVVMTPAEAKKWFGGDDAVEEGVEGTPEGPAALPPVPSLSEGVIVVRPPVAVLG